MRAKSDGANRADQREPDGQAISPDVHSSCIPMPGGRGRGGTDPAAANYAIVVGISTVFSGDPRQLERASKSLNRFGRFGNRPNGPAALPENAPELFINSARPTKIARTRRIY
jgi:hypothetical protein